LSVFAWSTMPLARVFAWSTMPRACSRAAAIIFSASVFALARSARAFSADARPAVISVWRCSIAPITNGQTNFMQNQTKTAIAMIWPISVMLMSTRNPPRVSDCTGASTPETSPLAAARLLELRDERIGEREVERDTDADHRHRVEQRDDEEHLGPQHARELGLTSGPFEPAAAEKSHADADAERAETDQDRHRNSGHTNHDIHLCLQSRRIAIRLKKVGFEKNSVRLARVVRLAQIHDRQHHEDVCLQSDHEDAEDRPHEMQRQLIQADQSNENEDELARIHVAEEPQRQRQRLRDERHEL